MEKVIPLKAPMTDLATGRNMPIYDDMENINDSLQAIVKRMEEKNKKLDEEVVPVVEEVVQEKVTQGKAARLFEEYKKTAMSELKEEVVEEEVSRLLRKYKATTISELTLSRLPYVLKTEKNMEICKKCKGLPCERPDSNGALSDYSVPNIKVIDGVLYVRDETCEYYKAYIARGKLEKGWHNAKIPKKYRGKSFADYEVTEDNAQAVKAAQEFLTSGTGGLFFYGNPGRGKTFLASIVAQEFMKAGKSVIFGDVPTLLEVLRDSFNDKNIKITDLMSNLAAVDLLVLDDLGTEIPTEWAVERIYSIVNRRYDEEKPVIVTSNYRMGEIAERLNHPKKTYNQKDEKVFPNVHGSRIVSRLLGMCKRLEFTGKDRRF